MYRKFDIWQTNRENPENEKYLDLIIEKNISSKNYPALRIWKGKALKPYHNYYYRSLDERENRLQKIKEERAKDLENKALRKEKEKQAIKNFKHNIKVGDIYYSSWGYDQTNIDYYEVVGVSGRAVWFQQIGQFVDNSCMTQDVTKPNRTSLIGEPFKKIVQFWYDDRTEQITEHFKLTSYSSLTKWDGSLLRQTNSLYGH